MCCTRSATRCGWRSCRLLGSIEELSCGRLEVSVSKSTLTHHLRVLRDAGLTYTRSEGVQRLVSLRRDEVEARFPGLLDCVLEQAEPQMAFAADQRVTTRAVSGTLRVAHPNRGRSVAPRIEAPVLTLTNSAPPARLRHFLTSTYASLRRVECSGDGVPGITNRMKSP